MVRLSVWSLALLGACSCVSAQSAKNLGKHDSHFLQLVVPDGDAEEVLKDLVQLKVAAKGMHERVGLLLQTAHTKVHVAMEKAAAAKKKADALAEKKAARDAKEAAENAAAESAGDGGAPALRQATFTTGADTCKPLSKSAGAKKCNIPRYGTAKEMEAAMESGAQTMDEPFLLSLNTQDTVLLDEVAARYWSAPALRTVKNVTVEYWSAHAAKMKRQSGMPGYETQETFTPEKVELREYFARCFGAGKRSGYDTEHCDQMVPLTYLASTMGYTPEYSPALSFKTVAGGRRFQAARRYEGAKREIIRDAKEAMAEHGAKPIMETAERWAHEQTQDADSRYLNFGPSGAGEQLALTRRNRPNMDVLLRGRRRHVFIAYETYRKLKQKAGDDFMPAAAFSFFETQYDELVHEFDFGRESSGLPFWECEQQANEVLYLPSKVVRVSLNLEDSLSFGMDVADSPEDFGDAIENSVWAPNANAFNLAVCVEAKHLHALPGWSNEKIKKQGLTELTKQLRPDGPFGSPLQQNRVIAAILADCAALKIMGRPDPEDGLPRLCDFAWDNCGGRFAKNVKELGHTEWPEWMPKQPMFKLQADGDNNITRKVGEVGRSDTEENSLDEAQFRTLQSSAKKGTGAAKKAAKKKPKKKASKKKKKKKKTKKEEL